MKREVKLLVTVMCLMALVFVGCDKDDNPITEKLGDANASYEVKLDGKTILKNNSAFVAIDEVSSDDINSSIMVVDKFTKDYKNVKEAISVNNIQNLKVGETIEISDGSEIEIVIITDFKKMKGYGVVIGSITKDAADKISFKASKLETYEKGDKLKIIENKLTGFVKSKVLKKIGKKSNF